MAEKKENNGGAAEKKKGDDGKKQKKKNKEEEEGGAVVLKIDMHCEGCASKITKYAKSVQGVEKAKVEWEASKLIVEGKVDPSKLLEKLQHKTKKKVQLVSPDPPNKTDDDNTADKPNNKKVEQKKEKPEEKKLKEPPVTTAVLKLGLHCHSCVDKIHKLVSKTTGVESVTVEMQKDLVTVTGTMDAAALAETLKTKMKRVVELVPQKKNKDKDHNKESAAAAGTKDNNNNNKLDKGKEIKEKDKLEKENESGEGNEKEDAAGNGGGGGKKKKKGGGGKELAKDEENGGGGRGTLMEGNSNRMEYFGPPGFANTGYDIPPPPGNGFGYGYYANGNGALGFYGNATPYSGYNYASGCGYGYGPMYADPYHAPQMFSDDNPNACSIM